MLKNITKEQKYVSAEEIDEYVKCHGAIVYFAERFFKIQNPIDGELKNLVLRDFQKNTLKAFQENRFNILMSSRQTGEQLTLIIYFLHYIIYNNDKNIFLFETFKSDFLNTFITMYNNLQFKTKPIITKHTNNFISFENGTSIRISSLTKNAAVGLSIDLAYVNGLSDIDDARAKLFYRNLIPTIDSSNNSSIIITSLSSENEFFKDLFLNAEQNKNNFNPMKIHWSVIPERLCTYITLDPIRSSGSTITINYIYSELKTNFPEIKMYLINDVITAYTLDLEIRKFVLNFYGGLIPLKNWVNFSTWEDEMRKEIGDERFEREYNLKF